MGRISKKILVIGASSLALEVSTLLHSKGNVVDNYRLDSNTNFGEFLRYYNESKFDEIILGVYSRRILLRIVSQFEKHRDELTFGCLNESLRDLSGITSEGCYLSPGVTISNNVIIGRFCYVGLNASIGHDVKIDDFVTIMPGARISGNTHVRSGAIIGSNAVIHQGVIVEKNMYIKPCEYFNG